jgi:hypothetical protein
MKLLLSTHTILILVSGLLSAQDPELIADYPFRWNANDISGNGHHGIVYGVTLTSDRFGNTNYAYLFDGVDDHIDVPYDSSFYPPSLCVTVWVKANSFPDTGACYILTTSGDKQTPPYDPFRLRVNSQRQVFVRFEGDTDSVHINMFSTTQLNAGGWYFIVAYYDNLLGRGALYINNVKEDSTDRPMALDKNAIGLRIGAEFN